MNTNKQISLIWKRLHIKGEEILIIPVFNKAKGSDEYYVTRKVGKELETRLLSSLDDVTMSNFRIYQRIGAGGVHIFPSVQKSIEDEEKDY